MTEDVRKTSVHVGFSGHYDKNEGDTMKEQELITKLTDATKSGRIHWSGTQFSGNLSTIFTVKIKGHTIEVDDGNVEPLALFTDVCDDRIPLDIASGGFTALLNAIKLSQTETEHALDVILFELSKPELLK